MIVKKLAITALAAGIMLASAAGVFAESQVNGGSNAFDSFNNTTKTDTNTSTNTSTKNINIRHTDVTRADITNSASVNNNISTQVSTGGNWSSAVGGSALSFTHASSGPASGNTTAGGASGGSTGGSASGGNTSGGVTAHSVTAGGDALSGITTGNADARSDLSNVVNTSVVHF